MNYSGNQLIITIDQNQTIKKVILNSIINLDIKDGEPVINLFKNHEHNKFFDFIKKADDDYYNIGTKIVLKNDFEAFMFYMKIKGDSIIFLIGFNRESNELFEEIMKLNNRQINEIRELKKQLSSLKTETDYLEETMKLNNELINIRRELSIKNRELELTNNRDHLTKINNRRKFFLDVYEFIKNDEYYLVMMDINNFKMINDELGHPKGDETLILFAKELCQKVKPYGGVTYRLGGDEFAVLVKVDSNINFDNTAKEIDNMLKKTHPKAGISYGLTKLSLKDGNSLAVVEESMTIADKQMYNMKKRTKNKL